MICNQGKLAIKCYFSSIVLFLLATLLIFTFQITSLPLITFILILTLVTIISTLKIIYTENDFQIAIRAGILGCLFALGVYIKLVAPSNVQVFGGYVCVMSFFHFSEFVAIAVVQPKEVSTNSFVINHSPQYTVAAISSWVEFFAEAYFFPSLKEYHWLSNVGLMICVAGELLRKISMLTAGSSFNHLVIYEKSTDHKLVTHGVYGWFRHPSYVGWFYWSIGTQIILLNPICIPAYAVASWMFFNSRIYLEEITLLNFYGQAYCNYQQQVWTGIPFNKGYRID